MIVQISTREINVGNFDPNVTIEATNLILESTVEGEEFKIPFGLKTKLQALIKYCAPKQQVDYNINQNVRETKIRELTEKIENDFNSYFTENYRVGIENIRVLHYTEKHTENNTRRIRNASCISADTRNSSSFPDPPLILDPLANRDQPTNLDQATNNVPLANLASVANRDPPEKNSSRTLRNLSAKKKNQKHHK
ncbi:hypothetical protein PVAND_009475 [Polypedilum vanderplanki]|uniref:Uncharacterized protein n=1 Tax=Polypedilum vanderplanki TaxID=319348 RepID=A0A9J6CCV3_POLVA|nr:hypothetical protein PVAND_009475 [Polypedilum vanderplanki]